MSELLKLTDRLWSGEASTTQAEFHPFSGPRLLEELAPGVAFFKAFVNVTAVKTAEGLVLVDTGSFHPASYKLSFDAIRHWYGGRVHTAVYTHGHVDHAYGLPPFLAEARARGWQPPRIVGHENVLPRMQRYVRTAGYNSIINTRQFGFATQWPVEFQAPTDTYSKALEVTVGGSRFQLHLAGLAYLFQLGAHMPRQTAKGALLQPVGDPALQIGTLVVAGAAIKQLIPKHP